MRTRNDSAKTHRSVGYVQEFVYHIAGICKLYSICKQFKLKKIFSYASFCIALNPSFQYKISSDIGFLGDFPPGNLRNVAKYLDVEDVDMRKRHDLF